MVLTTTRTITDVGKQLQKALLQLKTDKVLKVGWIENIRYPETDESVASVAAQNEYGYPPRNIPPRPFFRPTIIAKQNEWMKTIERGVKQILKGRANVEDTLDLLGAQVEKDVARAISTLETPALRPLTIAKRQARLVKKHIGRLDKPLIDTGIMLNALSHKVEAD